MGREHFTYKEATRLPRQESEPAAAIDRLRSMEAMFSLLDRKWFDKGQIPEVREQISAMATGIVDSPPEELDEVNGVVRSYIGDKSRVIRQLGRRLRREIRRASRPSLLRFV